MIAELEVGRLRVWVGAAMLPRRSIKLVPFADGRDLDDGVTDTAPDGSEEPATPPRSIIF